MITIVVIIESSEICTQLCYDVSAAHLAELRLFSHAWNMAVMQHDAYPSIEIREVHDANQEDDADA